MIQSDDQPSAMPHWFAGLAAAAVLHLLGGLILLRIQAPVPPIEPAMLLELAPLTEAPAAPPQPEPEPQPQPADPEPVPTLASPPDPPAPPPPEPVPPQEAPSPEQPPPPPVELPPPETRLPLDSAIPALPVPPPPPPVAKAVPRRLRSPPLVTANPTPPQPATATPPPSTPVLPPSNSAAATADWRARLLAHLNRFKRYPPAAQMRRQQGVAYVHLILLPDGSAQNVQLQTSSGNESLDQEALALMQRAQPLPVLPDDGRHELVIPIQFTMR